MEDKHFTLIYRYIFVCTLCVLLYVATITFIPIPEKNQRFVDIALAFLLGWISGNSQHLTGGNPKGKTEPQVPVTGDNTTVQVNPVQPPPTDTDSTQIRA